MAVDSVGGAGKVQSTPVASAPEKKAEVKVERQATEAKTNTKAVAAAKPDKVRQQADAQPAKTTPDRRSNQIEAALVNKAVEKQAQAQKSDSSEASLKPVTQDESRTKSRDGANESREQRAEKTRI